MGSVAGKKVSAVEEKHKASRVRAIGGGLVRLGAWLLAMSVAVGLLLAGVVYVTFNNLTETVNLLLKEGISGQEVRVDGLSFPEPGLLRIEGLKALSPDSGKNWLEVAKIEIGFDLEELKNHQHVKFLRLKQPVIRIDEEVVESLSNTGINIGGKKPAPSGKEPFDLGLLAKFSEEIQVEGGQAVVEWPGLPRMSFSFDSDLKGLLEDGGDKKAWVSEQAMQLSLREVEVGLEAERVSVRKIELEVMVSRDARVIEVRRLQVSEPDVKITPQLLAGFGVKKNKDEASGEKPTPPPLSVTVADGAVKQDGLVIALSNLGIQKGSFALSGFDGKDGVQLLPDVTFGASVDWSGIMVHGTEVTSDETLTLMLEGLSVDGAMGAGGESPLLRVAELELGFLPQDVIQRWRLERVRLKDPDLRLSAVNLARLAGVVGGGGDKASSESEKKGPSGSSKSVAGQNEQVRGKVFELGSLSVEAGHLLVKDMAARLLPDVETNFSGEIRELKLGAGQGVVSSPEMQSIHLSGLKVNGAALEDDEALLTASQVELDFKLDDLLGKGKVDRLEIQSPEVVVSDNTIARWLPGESDGKEGGDVLENSGESNKLAVPVGGGMDDKTWQIRDFKISKGRLLTRLEKSFQGAPWLSGGFDVATLPLEFSTDKDQMQEPRYRMHFSGLRIRPQNFIAKKTDESDEARVDHRGEISARDVAFVRDLFIEVTPSGLQKERRIENVVVERGTVKLGDDFQSLIGGAGTDGQERAKLETGNQQKKGQEREQKLEKGKAGSESGTTFGWRIGELGVNRTIVRIESMVPQLQGVQFSVETTMKDVPLSADGLISRHHIQQVEIAGIELRDPYDGMRTAALLPTIFLKFSLGGLMKQEVESVDILGPVLYVGEPLFNWVDYQRKYRKQNEGTSLEPEEWKEEGGEKAVKNSEGSWKLKNINAHYGKMVIAPIGTPIGIVPFPFEVATNLEDGQIALNLEIPQEQYVYSLADLKLDLYGLSGKVEFNVPIKQQNNNIWQNFKLDRLVWKQFDAENISVEVTYDASGIYGKLEGKAYEGYVNGAFNIYLKDLGKWDGWLAATKINMEPVTKVIAPENFVMDGIISGKIISNGNGLELGTTTGELEGHTPGRIEITKLESVLEALPKEWTQLKRSLTEAALNGLKAFDYDKASGKIDMVNRDGELELDLRGPTGSRVFHFFLHDWRKKKEGDKKQSVVSSQ